MIAVQRARNLPPKGSSYQQEGRGNGHFFKDHLTGSKRIPLVAKMLSAYYCVGHKLFMGDCVGIPKYASQARKPLSQSLALLAPALQLPFHH